MSDERLTMTVEEAAKLLSISRGLAYELVRRNELPHVRLGRRIVVPCGRWRRSSTRGRWNARHERTDAAMSGGTGRGETGTGESRTGTQSPRPRNTNPNHDPRRDIDVDVSGDLPNPHTFTNNNDSDDRRVQSVASLSRGRPGT